MPVLVIVLLGIIEVPLLISDYVAVTSAARTGARVAAAEPGCVARPTDPPCPATDPAPFAKLAADAVARNGTALSPESIRYILVYKANANGYPGALGSMPTTCAGVSSCVGYTWNATSGTFVHSSGTWDRRTVNACFPTNVDSVGVQVVADHEFLSGLLGSSMTMSEHAVMNFEPLRIGSCASGSHA
jgi:TadE-like protein